MILNEENIKEREMQLDVISSVPNISNKIDMENLKQITNHEMEEYEKRHLQELTEQTEKMDNNEQYAVARGLNPFIMIDVVKEMMYRQNEHLRKIEGVLKNDDN
jgi:hypothetical protein